jgi:hypothetical protein
MAAFTQTLAFTAADATEWASMKSWMTTTTALNRYAVSYNESSMTATLTVSGTRSTNWTNG